MHTLAKWHAEPAYSDRENVIDLEYGQKRRQCRNKNKNRKKANQGEQRL